MKTVKAVYFSATDTTKKVVCRLASRLTAQLRLPCSQVDFTLPAARQSPLVFGQDEIVVLGTPVYAGRVPNVLLPFLRTMQGTGAIGIPVVVYGNRNFDNALIELRDLMENAGIRTVAAAAFIGEHAFSRVLAAHRPDAEDESLMDAFASQIAGKVASMRQIPQTPVEVPGIPQTYGGYFQPRDRHGEPINILKVKPVVNGKCNDCKRCVEVCPMGSISRDDVRQYTGICIKCGACIKKCPVGARYYEDAGYLYHQQELEYLYARRAEPVVFLNAEL